LQLFIFFCLFLFLNVISIYVLIDIAICLIALFPPPMFNQTAARRLSNGCPLDYVLLWMAVKYYKTNQEEEDEGS